MNRAIVVLALLLVSGCAQLLPHQPQYLEPHEMLLDGIQALSTDGSTAKLEALIVKHPESRQAAAAMQLLKKTSEPQQAMTDNSGKAEVEKLRNQNHRLSEELGKLRQDNELMKNDLEKLRQLLIKSEKRSS